MAAKARYSFGQSGDWRMLEPLFLPMMMYAFTFIHYMVGLSANSVPVFCILALLFFLYTPVYIRQIKGSNIGAMTILCLLWISDVVALCGGLFAYEAYNYQGNVMIIIAGIINFSVLVFGLCYMLYKLYSDGRKILNQATLLPIRNVLYVALPMWYFPFLINSLVK